MSKSNLCVLQSLKSQTYLVKELKREKNMTEKIIVRVFSESGKVEDIEIYKSEGIEHSQTLHDLRIKEELLESFIKEIDSVYSLVAGKLKRSE